MSPSYSKGGSGTTAKYQYKKKAIATLTQSPPVQNTWYEVLATTEDVRILYLTIMQDNDDNFVNDLELKVTIDGVTLTGTQSNANDATNYYAYMNPASDALIMQTSRTAGHFSAGAIRGQSVKVEVRMTSTPDTNQILYGYVQYETLEET